MTNFRRQINFLKRLVARRKQFEFKLCTEKQYKKLLRAFKDDPSKVTIVWLI